MSSFFRARLPRRAVLAERAAAAKDCRKGAGLGVTASASARTHVPRELGDPPRRPLRVEGSRGRRRGPAPHPQQPHSPTPAAGACAAHLQRACRRLRSRRSALCSSGVFFTLGACPSTGRARSSALLKTL